MKHKLFLFLCALVFSFSSHAARIYYVQNTQTHFGKFVYGLEFTSSTSLWVYLNGMDPIRAKLGSDGIYRGKNTNTPIQIKVSSDLSSSSYLKGNSETLWTEGYRFEKLEDQCLVVDGKPICKNIEGTYSEGVVTLKNFYRDVRGEEYASRYVDDDYPYVVGSVEAYKDFIPLSIQNPSNRCVTETVCIGDKVYFKASDFLNLFHEARIKGFSVHGFVTEDSQLYTFALNYAQYKVFKHTYPKDCLDFTPNEIKKLQSVLAAERCSTLKGQGLAEMCTYTGVQTPWGSLNNYEQGDQEDTCIIQGTIYPWVTSPLMKED